MLIPVKAGKQVFAPSFSVLAFPSLGRKTIFLANSIRLQFACMSLLSDDKVGKKAMENLHRVTLEHRKSVNEQEHRAVRAYWRQLVNNS